MTFLKILFVSFKWYFWHRYKKSILVLRPHGKYKKSSRDKANICNPKINRGWPPLTTNCTSADCMEITPEPSVLHIPLGVYNTEGLNAMCQQLHDSRRRKSPTTLPLIERFFNLTTKTAPAIHTTCPFWGETIGDLRINQKAKLWSPRVFADINLWYDYSHNGPIARFIRIILALHYSLCRLICPLPWNPM